MTLPIVKISGARDLHDYDWMAGKAQLFASQWPDRKAGDHVTWVCTFSTNEGVGPRTFIAWWTKARAVSIRRES